MRVLLQHFDFLPSKNYSSSVEGEVQSCVTITRPVAQSFSLLLVFVTAAKPSVALCNGHIAPSLGVHFSVVS